MIVATLPHLKETPSQTAGPYVHIGLAPSRAGFDAYRRELGLDVAGEAPGTRIRVEGIVRDGMGAPVTDVLIESWQADAEGRHPHPEDPRHGEVHPSFRGWGRLVPDFATGLWTLDTVKPGLVPARAGHAHAQAPHLSLWLVARGINLGLHTRLYFDDEAEANAQDPVLNLIEQPARRETLLARRVAGEGLRYRFDIRLQGEGETVFFDV